MKWHKSSLMVSFHFDLWWIRILNSILMTVYYALTVISVKKPCTSRSLCAFSFELLNLINKEQTCIISNSNMHQNDLNSDNILLYNLYCFTMQQNSTYWWTSLVKSCWDGIEIRQCNKMIVCMNKHSNWWVSKLNNFERM